MIKYDSYKLTKIEFLDEIPVNWNEKRLRFLGYLYGGLSGKSANDFNQVDNDENKYYIPFTNIAGNLKINPNQLQEVIIKENEKQNKVKSGDLFFLMSSEDFDDVGKSSVLTEEIPETYLNSFCKGFRLKSKNIVPEFLNYHLHSKQLRHNLLIEANGFTRINLKVGKVQDLFVAFPDKKEQTAIATYLDHKTSEIDRLIADKKRLLELYEEEKLAVINEAVRGKLPELEWERLQGDKVSNTKNNPQILKSKTSKSRQWKDSGIEWLGKIPEHWEVKRLKYYFNLITEKANESLIKIGLENIESKTGKLLGNNSDFLGQGVKFKQKDILLGKLRPYLAKVWLSNFEGQAVGDFYVFRTNCEVLPEFAKYKLLDLSFIDVINSSTYGSKMPRVSWEFIADLPISFPPLDEQQVIVNHIEKECKRIDTQVKRTKKLIELLKEYRTALISEVVTGKVKVTE